MTRFTNRTLEWRMSKSRSWRYNADMYTTPPMQSLEEVRDEHRLRRALREAVYRDLAPQSLIDSIKLGIRQ
ncbi:MAG: hypothetical protein ABL984_21440 [Pyrinomonadaceae bacterium]